MKIKNIEQLIGSRPHPFYKYRKLLLELLEYAMELSIPSKVIQEVLASGGYKEKTYNGNIFVVSIGKAATGMAKGAEGVLRGKVKKGIIVTPYGYGGEVEGFRCLEAGHPLPDENSMKAGKEVLSLLDKAGKKDHVFLLVSGGGSSALAHPPLDVSLEEKRRIVKALFEKGADIIEINTVRKHLSIVKGGWLAFAASPARVINLVISDVPGDDISMVSSGPGVPDETTFSDALNILKKYNLLEESPEVTNYLFAGVMGRVPETPKPENPIFENVHYEIVLKNYHILKGIEKRLKENGVPCEVVQTPGGGIGELTDFIRELVEKGEAGRVYILGGEVPVETGGASGRGGPNQELAVRIAMENRGRNFVFASIDTDGKDGNSPYAGAIVDSFTFQLWRDKGINPQVFLEKHDSSTLLEYSMDVIETGLTGTNVNDIRLLFIPHF